MSRQLRKLVHTLGKIALCSLGLFLLWVMLVFDLSSVLRLATGITLIGICIIVVMFVWQTISVVEIALRWRY